MVRWQYLRLSTGPEGNPMPSLQRLGSEGWELVTILRTQEGGTWAFLKRPARDGDSEEAVT
jgi:hypothetical protein